MSIRDGMIAYNHHFGVRGVLAISAYRLFRQPSEISARPPGIQHQVHIRLRTTDPPAYARVLLHGKYAFDPQFSPKTILDAGANIGMASIYFTQRYPDAKIIAVEPEPSNFALLCRNVKPYPAITPVHSALWNRDGEISVVAPEPGKMPRGTGEYITREGPGTLVRAVTMNTLMKEMGISTIDLVKIDIEGAEREVFEDCRWLNATRCLMIEVHDHIRPGCTAAVQSAMQPFECSRRGEILFYRRKS